MRNFAVILFCLSCHIALAGTAQGAMPLVTDDAGTVGKGKVQIEIGTEITSDKEAVFSQDAGRNVTEKEKGGSVTVTGTVGIHGCLDLVLGVPYQWFTTYEDGGRNGRADGISDISLDVKWRFFGQDGWGLALKPGIILPTGDDDRGLGTGKMAYRLYFIATKEISPWAFHINLGYIRNENKVDERENLWHASAAAEWVIIRDLKAVANVGIERNTTLHLVHLHTDKSSDDHPAFALAGVIYRISESVAVDFGMKFGITKPEVDITYLFGVTVVL